MIKDIIKTFEGSMNFEHFWIMTNKCAYYEASQFELVEWEEVEEN